MGSVTRFRAAAFVVAAILAAISAPSRAQAPTAAPYTVLSREGRRPLPARVINGQEMFALDDLARLFELTVREDTAAGGITVSSKGQTIVLSPGQGLASVGGRLISLPAPPVRDGRAWFVPVDFVLSSARAGARRARRAAKAVAAAVDRRHPRAAARRTHRGARRPRPAHARGRPGHAAHRRRRKATASSCVSRRMRSMRRFRCPPCPTSFRRVRPGGAAVGDRRRSRSEVLVVPDLRRARRSRQRTHPHRGACRHDRGPGGAGAGRPPPTPTDPPPLLDLAPAGGLRTIVIDAGHGGDEHGAQGAGRHAREGRHAQRRPAAQGVRSRRGSASASS